MLHLEKSDELRDPIQSRVSDFLAQLSRTPSRALLLDYDGTLAPFTADRSQAVPYPAIPGLLNRIRTSTNTRLVVISGRRAPEVSALLGVTNLEVWGCHGFSRLHPDGRYEMPELNQDATRRLAELNQLLCQSGLSALLEIKPSAIAIHWRGVDADPTDIVGMVEKAWSALPDRQGLELLQFDGGIEIRIAGSNKGDAVRTILREMGAPSAVAYLGDDQTDEDAFAALRGHGLSVLVRSRHRPTLADVWIQPSEVSAFLSGWADACEGAS